MSVMGSLIGTGVLLLGVLVIGSAVPPEGIIWGGLAMMFGACLLAVKMSGL